MDRLEAALAGTGLLFARYAWDKAPNGDYGVISISHGDDFIADGHHAERGTHFFVDYFTRDTSDAPRNAIETALDGVSAFSLRSVQHEDETNYIHYEWVVNIVG
jgi:hypothetical protein